MRIPNNRLRIAKKMANPIPLKVRRPFISQMTTHLPIYSHCLESMSSIFLIRERGWPDLPAVVSIVDALFILWRDRCNDCSVNR